MFKEHQRWFTAVLKIQCQTREISEKNETDAERQINI